MYSVELQPGTRAEEVPVPVPRSFGLPDKPFMQIPGIELLDSAAQDALYRAWRVGLKDASFVQHDAQTVRSFYSYFSGLSGGRDPTPSFTLANGASELDPLTGKPVWRIQLEALIATIPDTEMRAWEMSRWNKVGRQGHIPPAGHPMALTTVLRYGRPRTYKGIPRYAYETILKEISGWHLTPCSDMELMADAHDKGKGNSSEGFPCNRKRKDCWDDTRRWSHSGECDAFFNKRGHRGQRQGPNPEDYAGLRAIFSTPASKNWRDASYALALERKMHQSAFCRKWFVADTGMGPLNADAHATVQSRKPAWIMSTDYSKMDTTVGYQLRKAVTELLSYAFEPQYRAGFVKSVMSNWDTPLVYGMLQNQPQRSRAKAVRQSGTGEVLFEPGSPQGPYTGSEYDFLVLQMADAGLSSGERWTHTLEDWISAIIHLTVEELGIELICSYIDGDDGMLLGSNPDQMDEAPAAFEYACSLVGVIGNADKQYLSRGAGKYLQCFFSEATNWYFAYSLVMAANALINPERAASFTCDADDPEKRKLRRQVAQALRQISIVENCKYHCLFAPFVDLVVGWTPKGMGTLIPGFFTPSMQALIAEEEQKLRDGDDLPQSMRSGKRIWEFETWKLLRARVMKEQGVTDGWGNGIAPSVELASFGGAQE